MLKVDRDGTGAAIYVQGRKPGDAASEYFHELLWIHRYHYIQPGCRVVHKNGISVDNRVANLEMVEIDVTTDAPGKHAACRMRIQAPRAHVSGGASPLIGLRFTLAPPPPPPLPCADG